MTARKLCGKKWPAHLCAPGSEHACTRPPGHAGQCACKCGHWATVRQTAELDGDVTVVSGSMPPHQHSQPVDEVTHNVVITARYSIPFDVELAAMCEPCEWTLGLAGGHDLADFITLYAQHAGIDNARALVTTALDTYTREHEEAAS